jgi:hypothetical protein
MASTHDRPREREAVKTTIVGGRPPGSGRDNGAIPRGIEVLIKKAAVDQAFRARLMEERAAVAGGIGLDLEPAEIDMINAIPSPLLENMITNTVVPDTERRAFLGKVAAVMLGAIGVVTGCDNGGGTQGVRPDEPRPAGVRPDIIPLTDGSRPDLPGPVSKGARPDRPEKE